MKLEDFFTDYALSFLTDNELYQANSIIEKQTLDTCNFSLTHISGMTIQVESGNWKFDLKKPHTELGKYRQEVQNDDL